MNLYHIAFYILNNIHDVLFFLMISKMARAKVTKTQVTKPQITKEQVMKIMSDVFAARDALNQCDKIKCKKELAVYTKLIKSQEQQRRAILKSFSEEKITMENMNDKLSKLLEMKITAEKESKLQECRMNACFEKVMAMVMILTVIPFDTPAETKVQNELKKIVGTVDAPTAIKDLTPKDRKKVMELLNTLS